MTQKYCCAQMQYAVESDEIPVVYVPKFREWGIRVLDGGPSYIRLNFCPWSGDKLPESLREAWFNKLEKLGIDPAKDVVPAKFSDDRWYTE
jgi:hypothetical protein